MTLKEAIEEFDFRRSHEVKNKNVRGYSNVLKHFCIFLRNPDMGQVTTRQMLEYVDWLELMGWDHNSLIERYMAFRQFMAFANRRGYVHECKEDVPLPRKQFKIPRVATLEQYEAMLDAIPKEGILNVRNRTLVMLLWNTGARNGEICSLNLSDLNLENCSALIQTEKSRGRRPIRQIFWDDVTNEQLKKWLKVRDGFMAMREKEHRPVGDLQAVFYAVLTKSNGMRLTTSGLSEVTRKLANKLGFHITPHAFRHSLGHRSVKAGVWPANLLGHSDPHSSDIYTWMVGDEAKEQWHRVSRFHIRQGVRHKVDNSV